MIRPSAIVLVILFSVPLGAEATVRISEVMYDVPGTDTGREWVEVVNEGSAIDLTTFRLFEAGVNHKITAWEGTPGVLASGAHAVIADNPAKFLEDWPTYSGALFDSAFSLSNTGEDLEIRDAEGVALFTVRYPTEIGGNGDGNSLHFNGSLWSVGAPTPGAAFTGSLIPSASSPTPSSQTQTAASGNSSGNTLPEYESSPALALDVVYRKIITAGADVPFSALLSYANGDEVLGAVYEWNFGDGSIAVGNAVYHHYDVPGQYALVVHGTKGLGSATKVFKVEVVPSTARIETITPEAIVIRNTGDVQIDLSRWHIRADMQFFTLPARTIILPNTATAFPFAITKLPQSFNTALLYPDGNIATLYDPVTASAPSTHVSFAQVSYGSEPSQGVSYAPLITAPLYDEGGFDMVYQPAATSASALVAAGAVAKTPMYWYALLVLLVAFSLLSAIVLRRYGI